MSAALTVPLIRASDADIDRPFKHVHPTQELGGTAFYRKRTEGLLRRYMRARAIA